MRQIDTVMEAVSELGCRTSLDVSDETGLSVKTASAHLSKLASQGLVLRKGQYDHDGRRNKFCFYEVKPRK